MSTPTLPSAPSPAPLSPGKQLAPEAGIQLIGVVAFASMCGLLWLLWRSMREGGGGGTPRHRDVDESPHAAPTPPVHQEQRVGVVTSHGTIIATGPASRPPFIIPGRGDA